MGDEFSVTVLLYRVVSCCLLTDYILDVSCRFLTYPDVSRYCMNDYCLPLSCSCTRDSLCLLSVLVIQTTQSDQSTHDVFPPKIHCREVSNAERVN